MESGQILMVKATDAGAVHDFPVFAKQTGNELIATATEGDTLIFYLKRR
jgi:tRNA 2-thiouridine synthesizing protein A